jgi:hypothetical protein
MAKIGPRQVHRTIVERVERVPEVPVAVSSRWRTVGAPKPVPDVEAAVRRPRSSAWLALALGATLSVASCSGGGGTAPHPATGGAGLASPAAASSAPSRAGSGSDVLTADDFVAKVGAAQKMQKSVRMSISATAAGTAITATATVDMRGSKIAMDEKVRVPGAGDVEIRLVDGDVYMNLGAATHGKWVTIDPRDADDPLAKYAGLLDGSDPTRQLDGVKGAITSAKPSGPPTTLDGVPVQKYVLTVDTAKLGTAMQDQLGAASSALPATLKYTYWIDSNDLMRKVETTIAGSKAELAFDHWGVPVAVTAPPAADILPGGLEGLGGSQA